MAMEFSSCTPGKVVVKQFINGLTSSTFTLKKFEKPPELPVKVAYPQGKVPINKNKMRDIMKLTEYTTGYEEFYDSILQWPTTDKNNPEDPTGDID